jgi:hypothetical protein
MELDRQLIHQPPSYTEQLRQMMETLPWNAQAEDPRRISYIDLVGMVLMLLMLWWII